jgi:hypothetical protein
MMRFFATWKGKVLTGTVLVLAGLLDLARGSQGLGIGLTVVGAAMLAQGLLAWRSARSS